jgi:hypothetical protein
VLGTCNKKTGSGTRPHPTDTGYTQLKKEAQTFLTHRARQPHARTGLPDWPAAPVRLFTLMSVRLHSRGATVASRRRSGARSSREGYRGHGLLTYNVLDALDRGDGDNSGTIEVRPPSMRK